MNVWNSHLTLPGNVTLNDFGLKFSHKVCVKDVEKGMLNKFSVIAKKPKGVLKQPPTEHGLKRSFSHH